MLHIRACTGTGVGELT